MLGEYINSFSNKTVCFVGLGISNLPILELFGKSGIALTVRDAKPLDKKNEEICKKYSVKVIIGDGYLEGIYEDVLFLSPAIKQFLPQFIEAASRGVYITTEMQEFFKLCPCKTIAVTGSDGKTTTTTLIAKFLEASGKRVHLGGNIGNNLLSKLDDVNEDDFAVAELSSFQLMKMNISPDIAVITNISPNHLDWHHDMDEYTQAKKVIFKHQTSAGKLVLNVSCEATAMMIPEALGKVITFGKDVGDFYITKKGIFRNGNLILNDADILLPGTHNRENYAAAIAATEGLVSHENIVELAKTFGGVEHRIELVRIYNGIHFYNSSIDSSPSRTAAALNSFENKVIVIAGGYDKNIPLEPLADLFERKTKAAILMGNTGPKIKEVLAKASYSGTIKEASDMNDAVAKAFEIAKSGDIVILSPAAASFDLFKNFAERGNTYKNIVNSL